MAKDYAKFIPPKSRPSKKSKGVGIVFSSVFLVATIAAAGGFYLYEKKPSFAAFAEMLKHKKPEAPVPKQVAAAAPTDPEVHFEFYDELPNMQVGDADTLALNPPHPDTKPAAQPTTAVADKTSTTEQAEPNAPLSPTAAPVVASDSKSTTQPKSAKTSQALAKAIEEDADNEDSAKPTIAADTKQAPATVNAEDLSNLLADEQSTKSETKATTVADDPAASMPASSADQRYIIELGVFDTEEAAKLLREAIVAVGFEPQIVKIKQGNRKVYQLQQGPYDTQASAKQSQQQLAKRGIISSLQKLS